MLPEGEPREQRPAGRGEASLAQVVTLEERGRPARPGLDALFALVQRDMAQVNALILQRMQSPVQLIPQLAGHLIAAGGKRLRPMLTVAAARLCGYEGERHHRLAAAVEFIHTATLLHDDVVDESDLRRGLATANALWGNKASVLVGDFLFARAFELMVADGSLRVLEILSSASAVITEGEVMQLVTANDVATTEGAYLEVIGSKTAALFAAACRIGAVVAERGRSEEEALDEFGRNLGIAYQLVDDALDYAADQAKLGKTVGDDFREGKITLPTILAYLRGGEEERDFWRRTLEELDQQPEDLARGIGLMRRHGALEDTIARARHYGAMARDALGVFPDGREKRALIDTVDFCIERAHSGARARRRKGAGPVSPATALRQRKWRRLAGHCGQPGARAAIGRAKLAREQNQLRLPADAGAREDVLQMRAHGADGDTQRQRRLLQAGALGHGDKQPCLRRRQAEGRADILGRERIAAFRIADEDQHGPLHRDAGADWLRIGARQWGDHQQIGARLRGPRQRQRAPFRLRAGRPRDHRPQQPRLAGIRGRYPAAGELETVALGGNPFGSPVGVNDGAIPAHDEHP